MKRLLFLTSSLLFFSSGNAQETNRPAIWGLAKMTFLVSDFNLARDYYGKFLGYEEAFSYSSGGEKIISFKVNDRQFLEFTEDKNAKEKNRLVSVSFNCDEIKKMESYLRLKKVEILEAPEIDEAGNEVLRIPGTEFYQIEFIHFLPGGLHEKSGGQFLGKNRVADRLHHAGLFVSDVEKADDLFCDVLGFAEMWRFKEGNDIRPNFIYMRMPDCVENVEYLITGDSNSSHPCFQVSDMQETIYTLKERRQLGDLARPVIGKGNRWLLNLKNADNTKVEFTEAFTVK
jgi:catechol 2,3-dioxygenase-like lactoylglutathione lyase family enzyme